MNLIRTQNTQGRDKRNHMQVSGATKWGQGEEEVRAKGVGKVAVLRTKGSLPL